MNTPTRDIQISELEVGEALVLSEMHLPSNRPDLTAGAVVRVTAVTRYGGEPGTSIYYRVDHDHNGSAYYPHRWLVEVLDVALTKGPAK